MVTPNALVEVLLCQFHKGDLVSQDDMECWDWIDDSWEDYVEDNPDYREPSDGVEMPFRVTGECVGFRFNVIGESTGDYCCGMDCEMQECGHDEVFRGCRDIFLEMAKPAPVKKTDDLGKFILAALNPKVPESRIHRIITAWNYWFTGPDRDGEYDSGTELLGQVRLSQVPYEVLLAKS